MLIGNREIRLSLIHILIHRPTCRHRGTLNHHRSLYHPTRDRSIRQKRPEVRLRRNNCGTQAETQTITPDETTIVTTPHGYKPGASGMTRPCRPTAFKASSKIFLLPLWSRSMTRPQLGQSYTRTERGISWRCPQPEQVCDV